MPLSSHQEPVAEKEETAHITLKPTNEDQTMVINLLNAVDKVLPLSLRSWKKIRDDSNISPAPWLLDRMRETSSAQAGSYPEITDEGIIRHKVLCHDLRFQ